MTTNKTFKSNGRTYEWGGGFGGVLTSFEKGLKEGDCRVIENRLFYVFMVNREGFFKKPRISWGIPGDLTAQDLRDLKSALFQ